MNINDGQRLTQIEYQGARIIKLAGGVIKNKTKDEILQTALEIIRLATNLEDDPS